MEAGQEGRDARMRPAGGGLESSLAGINGPLGAVEREALRELAAPVGALMLKASETARADYQQHKEVAVKEADDSVVTDTDFRLQEILAEPLAALVPGSQMLAEESAPKDPAECAALFTSPYLWALDSLDGTANFANGIPLFAVSAGLLRREAEGYRPVFGAVALPAVDELFWNEDGRVRCLAGGRVFDLPLEDAAAQKAPAVAVGDSFGDRYRLLRGPDLKYPRLLGSTTTHALFTALGRLRGTFTDATIWDLAGSLAIGAERGVHAWDYTTGKRHDLFQLSDFITDNPKKMWRLRAPLVISSEAHLKTVQLAVVAQRPPDAPGELLQ